MVVVVVAAVAVAVAVKAAGVQGCCCELARYKVTEALRLGMDVVFQRASVSLVSDTCKPSLPKSGQEVLVLVACCDVVHLTIKSHVVPNQTELHFRNSTFCFV